MKCLFSIPIQREQQNSEPFRPTLFFLGGGGGGGGWATPNLYEHTTNHQSDGGDRYVPDTQHDREAADPGELGRSLPQPPRRPPPHRPAVHPLPGHVPLRPHLHRGGHAQLYGQRAAQLRQDEDGQSDRCCVPLVCFRFATIAHTRTHYAVETTTLPFWGDLLRTL